MAFKKGESGNPSGRAASKPFLDALDRAIAQDNAQKLRAAAEKLLEKAAEGEPWAIQMLADRLDGKPVQTANVNVVKRDIREYTDEELYAIASGAGVAEAPSGPGESDRVH